MVYRGNVKGGVVVLEPPSACRKEPKFASRRSLRKRSTAAGRKGQTWPKANEICGQSRRFARGCRPESRPLPLRGAQTMKRVFADTVYYLALTNPRDQYAASATRFTPGFRGRSSPQHGC